LFYHLPLLGANTTAVQMAAPVWKLLDQPSYRGAILKCILVKYNEWCCYSLCMWIESRPICNHSNTFLGFYAVQRNS